MGFWTEVPSYHQDSVALFIYWWLLTESPSIKAALDELFDHGRPTKVELAVLVDRGGRRLPLAADYVGLSVAPSAAEKVVVHLDPASPRRDTIRLLPAGSAARSAAL